MPYLFALNGREYGEPQGFATTISLVNQKAGQWGGAYRVKPSKVEPWSEEMGRPAALIAVSKAMRKAAWGGLVKVEMGTRKPKSAVFLVKKVMPQADPLRMYTGAVVDLSKFTPAIAGVADYAKRKVPRVQCSGAVYTRNVAGTSTWSQHSNWPAGGNAIDLTCYIGDDHNNGIDMTATVDVADTLVAAARANALNIHRIIVEDCQWVYPAFNASHYGGTYHTHVHVEGRPLQSGEPVDAR